MECNNNTFDLENTIRCATCAKPYHFTCLQLTEGWERKKERERERKREREREREREEERERERRERERERERER